MNDVHLDVSKAVFSDTDDLMGLGSSDGSSSREIADGHVVSLEATNGQRSRPVVRDRSGKLLESFNLVATDAQGAAMCWICFKPDNGPFQCHRGPCAQVSVETLPA